MANNIVSTYVSFSPTILLVHLRQRPSCLSMKILEEKAFEAEGRDGAKTEASLTCSETVRGHQRVWSSV